MPRATGNGVTAPLVFLGRLDRCKGAHHAIAVARRLQRRLIIAGNVSPLAHEQQYFNDEIAPQIDGELVTYVGPVDDEQKRTLLGQAAAQARQQNCGSPDEWSGGGGRNGGQHRHGNFLSNSNRNTVSLPTPFLPKACCQHGVSSVRRVRLSIFVLTRFLHANR